MAKTGISNEECPEHPDNDETTWTLKDWRVPVTTSFFTRGIGLGGVSSFCAAEKSVGPVLGFNVSRELSVYWLCRIAGMTQSLLSKFDFLGL